MKIQCILILVFSLLVFPEASAQTERRPASSARETGATRMVEIPEAAAPVRYLWGDVDEDSLRDLFVLDARGNLFFRNLGKAGFEDVTTKVFPDAGAGAGGSGFFGDYNGDSRLDLFLFQEKGFVLFRNDGDLHFTDVTDTLGMKSDLPIAGARLEDIDGDGYQDLLLDTAEGDKIFNNREGSGFGEVSLPAPAYRSGNGTGTGTGTASTRSGPVLGGSSTGNRATRAPVAGLVFEDVRFVNDNSPASVGIGMPEVEGGDDTTTPNDIVDGTVTGDDIQDGSVSPSKVMGKAATLTGSQKFDGGTFVIDAVNNRVGVNKTSPQTRFHAYNLSTSAGQTAILGEAAGTGGVGVAGESSSLGGTGVYGEATATVDPNYGVYGKTASTGGRGVFGEATALSGSAYGVFGETSAPGGNGVYGRALSSTGYCYGINGRSDSTTGVGCFGSATAATGETRGVFGVATSTTGRGVYGQANSSTGINYGVYGKTYSSSGYGAYGNAPTTGVYGIATGTSGLTYGVRGDSSSTLGSGVFGNAVKHGVSGSSTASSGYSTGVSGAAWSTEGVGVQGTALAASGICHGVFGSTSSISGNGVRGAAPVYGVYGQANSAGYHSTYGVYGETTASASGYANYGVAGKSVSTVGAGVVGSAPYKGVRGSATSTSGNAYGIYGETSSPYGAGVFGKGGKYGLYGDARYVPGDSYGVYGVGDDFGVYGKANLTGGYGVYGKWNSYGGYGVYSEGNMGCSGTKSFVQPHPQDASKEIRFVCLEGNESGTYFRGSAHLEKGSCVIEVPEAFRLVTEAEGLTVQITPSAQAVLWVEEKGLDRIVVAGDRDVAFDYFVNGVRLGYADFNVIRENRAYVPSVRGEPYGVQYPEKIRKILMENGTLNPDLTPNEGTAQRLGWRLEAPEKDKAAPPSSAPVLKSPPVQQRLEDRGQPVRDARQNPALPEGVEPEGQVSGSGSRVR